MDYDDPVIEGQWCDARRAELAAYLARERLTHGRIGEWPAWHLAPHLSIWAIESHAKPGWVGWWGICGDLPTDHVSAATIKHPREALLAFADRWRTAAEQMSQGRAPSDFSIGSPADWPELAPMLATRAALMHDLAADERLWDER